MPYCHNKSTPCMVHLSPIFPKECNEPIPRALILNYSGSYRQFLFRKLQLIKIKSHRYFVTLLNAILYKKLSQWHGFQAHHSAVISTTCMLIYICTIDCLFIISSYYHGCYHIYFFFEFFGSLQVNLNP